MELEIIQLKPCRWRGTEFTPGHYDCFSSKLRVSDEGVTAADCNQCYCCDHAPITSRVILPAIQTPAGKCEFLGPPVKNEHGENVKRICHSCGNRQRQVFQCLHEKRAPDEITLLDCSTCPLKSVKTSN